MPVLQVSFLPLFTQVYFNPEEIFSSANFLHGLPGLMEAAAEVKLSERAMLEAKAIARMRFIRKKVAVSNE